MITRKERANITNRIGNVLEHFCDNCPNKGGMTLSNVCVTCPVLEKTQQLGELLQKPKEIEDPPKLMLTNKRWTTGEERKLIDLLGEYPIKEIAEKLNRTHKAVSVRVCTLRKRGLL